MRLRLAKVVKPTYRLRIGARVNAALLTYLLTYDKLKIKQKNRKIELNWIELNWIVLIWIELNWIELS